MQGQEERPEHLSSSLNPATGELIGVTPEDSAEILRCGGSPIPATYMKD